LNALGFPAGGVAGRLGLGHQTGRLGTDRGDLLFGFLPHQALPLGRGLYLL